MSETPIRPTLLSTLASAGRMVEEADPGTRAELRRLNPALEDRWQSSSFFRLLAALFPERTLRSDEERGWATILAGLALIDHRPDGPAPGALLAKHDFSEIRFARLLEADESQLPAQLRSMVHYLSSKGVREMDWLPLAYLLLDSRGHDRTCRQLSMDYYAGLASPDKPH